jgi:prepilin-type N-terminal cleavage/methylation domain-containing protein/prepilin-type processing-associated H-X9-DG protein
MTLLIAPGSRSSFALKDHRLPAANPMGWTPPAGFTLVELVVVVAMFGVLATMLAPTMARTKTNSASFQCRNNLRQLALGWKMYADDNNGNLVYNRDGDGVGGSSGRETWVGGWLDYSSRTDNTNTALLIDHSKYPYAAFLGPYVKTPLVFKCPADRSTALLAGAPKPRVRSVSMNSLVGTGSRTWVMPGRYPLCTNLSQINSPAYKFVFVDEREESINDGEFMTDPDTLYQLVDYPASYHNNAGSFSFADGHSEIHRWKDPRTMPVLRPGQSLVLNLNLPGDMDVLWLAQHAAGVVSYP